MISLHMEMNVTKKDLCDAEISYIDLTRVEPLKTVEIAHIKPRHRW